MAEFEEGHLKLTPEMSRRRLKLALREAREARQLTQRGVAKSLAWSLSKLIRIEAGAVGVSVTDVRAMIDEYEVSADARKEFEELARSSRGQSWTSNFSKHFSAQALTLFALEQDARRMYKHESTFVSGLLQTTEYSQALLRGLGVVDEERIDAIVNARAERQDLLQEEPGPRLHFLLGEAAVSRPVGGYAAMRRQLHRMVELNEKPGINIQLVPFSVGPHPKVGEAFTILEFDDPKMQDTLYLENAGRESVSRDDATEISEYLIAFEHISDLAYPPDQLESRLEAIITQRFSGDG